MEASLLDEIVDALTTECGIDATSLRAEALRLYLNTHSTLRLDGAVALWRQQRISLAKVAEIAGLTVPELKEVLARRGLSARQRAKAVLRWTPNCMRSYGDHGHSRHRYSQHVRQDWPA
jgi:predicted HTH domain antitoxin